MALDPVLGLAVAVACGGLVLSLDRLTVATTSWTVWTARVLLAVVLGAILSSALTLRIFAPDIEHQLAQDRPARVAQARVELAATQNANSADTFGPAHSSVALARADDDGVLPRLHALDEVSAAEPTVRLGHWTLFAVLVLLQALPLLVAGPLGSRRS
jgi:hypothetical protein